MSFRGVKQLKSLAIRYCNVGGSSQGVRDFVKSQLVQVAKENPEVSFRVQHLSNRHPVVFAEYLDGTTKTVGLKNTTLADVVGVVTGMKNVGTGRVRDLRKPVLSKVPSIQGAWDPSVSFKELSVREGRLQ